MANDSSPSAPREIRVPESNRPRVVIVGGGFGGITLAEALRDAPFQVVLLDRNNYHTFLPLLYQVASAGLEPDSIVFPLRSILEDSPNVAFRMAEVASIDPARRRIATAIGELSYDTLVIATGTRSNFFGLEKVAERASELKSLDQALEMRSRVLESFEAALQTSDLDEQEALMNFVVAGGGATGVELAGALAELKRHVLPTDYPELDLRKMRIHLVEASPRLLGGMSRETGELARRYLEELGVEVWLETSVGDYDGRIVRLGDSRIPTRNLIWTAGVAGDVPAGLEASRDRRSGRLKVDAYLRVAGLDGVHAIGDAAIVVTPETPHGHPMVAPVAIQQARLLARNLIAAADRKDPRPFVYNDKGSMVTIGRNRAIAEIGGRRFGGFLAWLLWMGLHLVTLMGFRNRLVVFINWIWNYLTYDRGTRLILRPRRPDSRAPDHRAG